MILKALDDAIMTSVPPPLDSSADSFNRDIESQSVRPSLSSSDDIARDSDHDGGLGGGMEKKLTLTERGEADPYPDGINAAGNDAWDAPAQEKAGPITRMLSRSSCKDPGPPPDGGLLGWTQGVYLIFSSFAPP